MFSMCQQMKFNHLPAPGGIYDQHPQLMDEWRVIFSLIQQKELADEKKRERESRNKSRSRGR